MEDSVALIIHHSALCTSVDDDLDAFRHYLEGHGQLADEFAVGLDGGVAIAADALGREEGDAGCALARAAAHGLREQAQVAQAAARVDDADLEGRRVEPRARRDLEAAAVPRRFADGRVGRRQRLAPNLDRELARLPSREVSEARVPECGLADRKSTRLNSSHVSESRM